MTQHDPKADNVRSVFVTGSAAISSHDPGIATETRSYRFTITFNVEPEHPAYLDPEWAADAAWGALMNEYGLRAVYTNIRDVDPPPQI